MSTLLLLALIFILTGTLVGLILLAIQSGGPRVRRRLRAMAASPRAPKAAKGSSDRFPSITGALDRRGYLDPLSRWLSQAGADLRASEFTVIGLVCALVPLVAVWVLTRSALFALLAAIVGGAIPPVALAAARERRLKRFEEQLPDGLMLIASSLRSGYGFMRAVQVLCQEMQPPIATEFKKTMEEVNLGITTEEALRHMAERVKSYDLEITVSAVGVQLQVGGNLAELLETVAETIRERQRIRAEVATLTAEAKLSGIILFVLPLVMLVVVMVLNPGYISPLVKTQFGHILGVGALVSQAVGGLVIHRMLQLEV